MKYPLFFTAFLCGAALLAQGQTELFNWSLLWNGSWEEFSADSGTLHNRGEFKLNLLPQNLTLRGQMLGRRPLTLASEIDPEKQIISFNGGVYHKPTGSRLLYGTLDEWGLSARVRNPWIRSPPYAENHKPLIADLKTAVSTTKEDEAYLYLSSPVLNLFPKLKFRSFISAQKETKTDTTAAAGGIELFLPDKTNLAIEGFYTRAVLPPVKRSSWFSDPPPLPEREFQLYSAGLLFSNPLISVSSDFAVSDTFSWGADIYCNLGITLTLRPLSISLAADGAGKRFIYRDGADHGEGFRAAAKIEWKGKRSSLFRFGTVLRGPEFGSALNRSSTDFYYRFPSAGAKNTFPVRLTRISLSIDRNGENSQKITDSLSGYIGFSFNLLKKAPFGLNISGSIKGITAAESYLSPYPVPESPWIFSSAAINCDFIWSPLNYQLRSRVGYSNNAKNDEKWYFSLYMAARFRHGRLGIKVESPDCPEKWNFSIFWRVECH
uniref:Uncharacterized protein n=1 Tax=uncultured bacterium contig00010 TaxID=1181502 RepID=A0A806KAK0_9BACT|nr:hypothetical protein [uncultured bacterium contig00010]